MKKIGSNIIHLVLLLLVSFSLLMTMIIIRPSSGLIDFFKLGDHNATTTVQKLNQAQDSSDNKIPLLNVYRAQEVIFYDGSSYRRCMLEDTLQRVMEQVGSVKIEKSDNEQLSSIHSDELKQKIEASHHYVELVFSDQVPLRFLEMMNGQSQDINMAIYFNRIGYFENSGELYLINDEEQKAYILPIKFSGDTLFTDIKQNEDQFVRVVPVKLGDQLQYLTVDKQRITSKTYMIERQSNQTILQTLFSSPEEIHDYSDLNISRYFTDNKSLIINNTTYQAEYNSDLLKKTSDDYDTLFLASYEELQNIVRTNENWRYVDSNKKNNAVLYRRFINQLPVFGADYVSRVQFNISENKSSHLKFSALMINTPISDLEQTYELPSGFAVLKALERFGLTEHNIEGLYLGYYWTPNPTSNRLVDLLPTWMVKINGEYVELGAVIDISQYTDLQTINVNTNEALKSNNLRENDITENN